MTDAIFSRIRDLNPAQFENLAYESLRALGMRNLTWRTPGADGGRDIEGYTTARDIAGFEQSSRWFVECKHYASSIDWPTVWNKLAYAESSEADFLLMVTTSNPSPKCETEIDSWNKSSKWPKIRFWRGYEIANIIRGIPAVGATFGLITEEIQAEASLLPLATLLSKTCENAYTRTYFSPEDRAPVEAAAAISELFTVRLSQLKEYGKPVRMMRVERTVGYDWVTYRGDISGWEELPLRAIMSLLRDYHHAKNAHIEFESDHALLTLGEARISASQATEIPSLGVISTWSRLNAVWLAEDQYRLEKLPYV